MLIVAYGGTLPHPITVQAATVHDPLTEGLGESLVRAYHDMLAAKVAQILGNANCLDDESTTVDYVWQEADWEANFRDLSLDQNGWSDWEPCEEQDGMERRFWYLGSVMNNSPSGKVYYPFACSNVLQCPCCEGRGEIPNPQHDPNMVETAAHTRRQLCEKLIEHWGAYACGKWPAPFSEMAAELQRMSRRHAAHLTCPLCESVGSAEVHQDELWREALESRLEQLGLCLQAGEGDPCDLYAVEYREVPDDANDDDDD